MNHEMRNIVMKLQMRVSKPQKPQQKHWPRFDSKKSMSNRQNFASEKPKKKKK